MKIIAGHPLPFFMAFCVAELLVFMAVGLMAWYTFEYSGVFDWEKNPANFHPFFMTLGLIFCMTQGMLGFRILRHCKKPVIKVGHFLIHSTAFCCVVVGLRAQYNSIKSGIHAHSLHSWLGLGTVLLFACQLSCGFITFLLPGLQLRIRQFYLPIHTFFGMAIFCMAVATALMGVTEKILWSAADDFMVFQPKATVLKCFAITLVLLALTLAFAVANPRFKRIPLPEEMAAGIETEDEIQNGGLVNGREMPDLKRRQVGTTVDYS